MSPAQPNWVPQRGRKSSGGRRGSRAAGPRGGGGATAAAAAGGGKNGVNRWTQEEHDKLAQVGGQRSWVVGGTGDGLQGAVWVHSGQGLSV